MGLSQSVPEDTKKWQDFMKDSFDGWMDLETAKQQFVENKDTICQSLLEQHLRGCDEMKFENWLKNFDCSKLTSEEKENVAKSYGTDCAFTVSKSVPEFNDFPLKDEYIETMIDLQIKHARVCMSH